MFECLSDRNDPHIILPFSVGHRDHNAVEQAQRDQALLPIRQARVLGRDRGAVKDRLRVAKVNPMLSKVELPLGFVPRDHGSL